MLSENIKPKKLDRIVKWFCRNETASVTSFREKLSQRSVGKIYMQLRSVLSEYADLMRSNIIKNGDAIKEIDPQSRNKFNLHLSSFAIFSYKDFVISLKTKEPILVSMYSDTFFYDQKLNYVGTHLWYEVSYDPDVPENINNYLTQLYVNRRAARGIKSIHMQYYLDEITMRSVFKNYMYVALARYIDLKEVDERYFPKIFRLRKSS
jgi:hypothetical protein